MAYKNFTYSVSEFFYDNSFIDYNQSTYVLTYRQKLTDTLYCPDKIVLNQQLWVLAYEPKITTDLTINAHHDVLGIFNAAKDKVGVYGSYQFLEKNMHKIIHELYEDGVYMFAPFGTVIYNQHDEVMEYVLKALYLKCKNTQ